MILEVIYFNKLLFNKINLVHKKLVCNLFSFSIRITILIMSPYLEKISPWCLNNISTMRLIGYDQLQNNFHFSGRSIKINRINFTPTTNTIKQTIIVVMKDILIFPAIAFSTNPSPFGVPNPGIRELIIGQLYSEHHADSISNNTIPILEHKHSIRELTIGQLYSEHHAVSLGGVARKNDPLRKEEAGFFKCKMVWLRFSVKIRREQIHEKNIISI